MAAVYSLAGHLDFFGTRALCRYREDAFNFSSKKRAVVRHGVCWLWQLLCFDPSVVPVFKRNPRLSCLPRNPVLEVKSDMPVAMSEMNMTQ